MKKSIKLKVIEYKKQAYLSSNRAGKQLGGIASFSGCKDSSSTWVIVIVETLSLLESFKASFSVAPAFSTIFTDCERLDTDEPELDVETETLSSSEGT